MELESFLQAAWYLAILFILATWFPLPRLGWLQRALMEFCMRGKILQSNTKLTVPQRFFIHFYASGVLWTTILLVSVWFYAITMLPSSNDQKDFSSTTNVHLQRSFSMIENVQGVWLSVFMLLLMEAQVLRRLYESIYVFHYSSSARLHAVGYFVGIFFYTATPLSLCCTFAPQVFDFVKRKHYMLEPGYNIWMFVSPLLRLGWYAWIGAAIFLWGWLRQLRCHQILGSLRKKPEKREEYVIPHGDWFEYVSCPHYTAEIVIYGGLLVASGGSNISLLLLFVFVVANLGVAATITHQWYLQKFKDYPRNRCAIFPFVC